MRRVFLDTNFILDYLIREDYKGNAEKVMELGCMHGITFCISFLSVANIAYVLRKENINTLKSIIKRICDIFEIVDNNKSQIEKSVEIDCIDYEDCLQYIAAAESNCECIITRNRKDFLFSHIPVFTPVEFISLLSRG